MTQPTCTHRSRGFTLLENLVAISLLAILLTFGIPELSTLIARMRQTDAINTMITHLHLARSEAVTQRFQSVLCASSKGVKCQKSVKWSEGYLVFIDRDEDRKLDGDEKLIRYQKVADSVHILTTAGRKTITFQTTGMSPGSNITITFCDAAERIAPRAVIVSNTGRARVSDTRPDGKPLTCT